MFINIFFYFFFHEYKGIKIPSVPYCEDLYSNSRSSVKAIEIAEFISGMLDSSAQQLQKHFLLAPHMVPGSSPAFVTFYVLLLCHPVK